MSLDWIKSDRNREGFLRSCGAFVIVDEVHTCAARKGGGRQQRYELLRGLAAVSFSRDEKRKLSLRSSTFVFKMADGRKWPLEEPEKFYR